MRKNSASVPPSSSSSSSSSSLLLQLLSSPLHSFSFLSFMLSSSMSKCTPAFTSRRTSSLSLRAWHLLASFADAMFMLLRLNVVTLMMMVVALTAIALSPKVTALPPLPPLPSAQSPTAVRASLAAQSDLLMTQPHHHQKHQHHRQHRKQLPYQNVKKQAEKVTTPATVAVAATSSMLLPGQAVIAAVPEEQRGNFILYQLALALKSFNNNNSNNNNNNRYNNDNSNNNNNKNESSNKDTFAVSYQKPRLATSKDDETAAIVVATSTSSPSLGRGLGLSPRQLAVFKSLPNVYDSFSRDLLHWIKQSFNSTDMDVQHFVNEKKMLCTIDGICYNQNDIGCYCCPF